MPHTTRKSLLNRNITGAGGTSWNSLQHLNAVSAPSSLVQPTTRDQLYNGNPGSRFITDLYA